MKTTITHRTFQWIFFEAYSDKPIYESDAALAQKDMDYDPMGYGLYSFRSDGNEKGYIAHWKCATTCN
jgi:hypothetical protein